MDLSFYLSLFPAYCREMTRFSALAEAVLRQAADLTALMPELISGFSVGNAAGVQLDAVGESFGFPRQEGWDDETYRGVLLRKLKRITWDGTNESVPSFLAEGEGLCDNGDGTVTVTAGDLPLAAEELLPVPMGVKTI